MRNTVACDLMAGGLRRAVDILLAGTVVREIHRPGNISVCTLAARGRRINGVLRIGCQRRTVE